MKHSTITATATHSFGSAYTGKKIVVLGAAGFIGRWVARHLSHQGANLSLVVLERASAEAVFTQYGIRGTIFEFDLRNSDRLREFLRLIHPTIVFNLAGYGVNRNERDEETSYQINHVLVRVVAETMAEQADPGWNGQSLIHVGSALEYGNINGDLRENSSPNPTTHYGKSKLIGTQALQQVCQQSGLRGLVARLFTIYGPGEHPGRLLPSLLQARPNGAKVPLTTGEQRRDFTYVEDVAEGLLRLGLSAALAGEIVNLATGKLHSVREFALVAAGILSLSREQLLFGEIATRPEEMIHDPVNIQRLVTLLGWSPQTGLDEGVARTLAFEEQSTSQAESDS